METLFVPFVEEFWYFERQFLIECNCSFSAPPSYEESKNGAKTLWERGESEHIFGLTNHFAPRYPVYNFMPVQ